MDVNWASFWSMKAPPRVMAFGWTALLGGIKTMDNLRRQRVPIVNACPMCLAGEESIDHLLLNCSIAQYLWRMVLGWFYVSTSIPHSLLVLFEFWRLGVGFKKGKIMLSVSLLAVIRSIWKERNLRGFEGKSSEASTLVEKINYFVVLWVSSNPLFKGYP